MKVNNNSCFEQNEILMKVRVLAFIFNTLQVKNNKITSGEMSSRWCCLELIDIQALVVEVLYLLFIGG